MGKTRKIKMYLSLMQEECNRLIVDFYIKLHKKTLCKKHRVPTKIKVSDKLQIKLRNKLRTALIERFGNLHEGNSPSVYSH